MSRSTVRQAITAWFAPPAVVGLNTFYPSRPKDILGTDYGLANGPGFGAVGVLHLPASDEVREALGGPTSGKKQVVYTTALEILFQSVLPAAQDGHAAHDTMLDNLLDRIRQDRTFGTGGTPIWQAGEGPHGITVDVSIPALTPQALSITTVVKFETFEWVTA